MSDQPAQQNPGAAEQPQMERGIERLPIPDSRGPNQHDALRNPLGDGPNAFHNYFMRNLNDERQGNYTPGAYSADPVVNEDRGQPVGPVREQPPAEVVTSNQPEVRQPPAEQPVQQQQATQEPDQGQPAALPDEGLEVDGERYTPDRIRELVAETEKSGMRLSDYTRKTQIVSRIRNEAEAFNTELTDFQASLERKSAVIRNLADYNVAQLEQADIRSMTPEQHASYIQTLDNARKGRDAIHAEFDRVDNDAKEVKDRAFQRLSNQTIQLLKFHEPRWNGEFYGVLRAFAVGEGLMSEKAFDAENDFLRMCGLISMMDRHTLPETIRETVENPRPPERQQNVPQRDSQGRFRSSVAATQNAVLNSRNARGDGTARDFFRAKLEDERRRGVQPPRQ